MNLFYLQEDPFLIVFLIYLLYTAYWNGLCTGLG